MKSFLAFLLASSLVLSLPGCGGEESNDGQTNNPDLNPISTRSQDVPKFEDDLGKKDNTKKDDTKKDRAKKDKAKKDDAKKDDAKKDDAKKDDAKKDDAKKDDAKKDKPKVKVYPKTVLEKKQKPAKDDAFFKAHLDPGLDDDSFTRWTVANIPSLLQPEIEKASGEQFRSLSVQQLRAFTPDQIHFFTSHQLVALSEPGSTASLRDLTDDQVLSLAKSLQFPAVGFDGIYRKALTPEEIFNCLTLEQFHLISRVSTDHSRGTNFIFRLPNIAAMAFMRNGGEPFKILEEDAYKRITPAALRVFDVEKIEKAKDLFVGIQYFSNDQISAIHPTYFTVFYTIPWMKPEQVPYLTNDQLLTFLNRIHWMTDKQIKQLTAQQLDFLNRHADQFKSSFVSRLFPEINKDTVAQMGAQEIIDLQDKNTRLWALKLRAIAAGSLTVQAIQSLNKDQLQIFSAEQFKLFDEDQIQAFSPQQIASFPTVAFGREGLESSVYPFLSAAQIQALSHEQLNELGEACTFKRPPKKLLNALTPKQIKGLKGQATKNLFKGKALSAITQDHFQALTPGQLDDLLKDYSSRQVLLEKKAAWFTAEQIQGLNPDTLTYFRSDIKVLTPAQFANLDAAQLGKIAQDYGTRSELTAKQVQAILPATLAGLSGEDTQRLLSNHKIRHSLSKEQVGSLTVKQIDEICGQYSFEDYFTASQLAEFSSAQIGAISQDRFFSAKVIQALSVSQLQAIPAQKIGSLFGNYQLKEPLRKRKQDLTLQQQAEVKA